MGTPKNYHQSIDSIGKAKAIDKAILWLDETLYVNWSGFGLGIEIGLSRMRV